MDKPKSHQDDFLLLLIKQNNKEAFSVLFRYYYSGLVVFATHFLQSKEEAEEIIQDIFLKIWSDREHLNVHTSLRDYLFRSVKNKCLDVIKHKKVESKFEHYIHQREEQSINHEFFIEQELRVLIKDVIEKLPTECRKVFVLSRIQNLKYKEIADKLGISVKTVENQISKALRIFRDALKDYL